MMKLLALLLVLVTKGVLAQTAISALPAATTVDGSEVLPIVQSSTTKKATLSLLNQPRSTVIATGTSFTPNADTSDVVYMVNTAGSDLGITINAPTGSPVEGQALLFWFKSTNAQTLTWNAVYVQSSDLAKPTATTGSSKYDYLTLRYNATSAKWHLLGKNFGGN